MIWFHKDGTLPPRKPGIIFVFGSNDKGVHGKGAALAAVEQFGAIRGQAEGRQGNSFAIVTRSARWDDQARRWHMTTMNRADILDNVNDFIEKAERAGPRFHFFVTRVGCGLAGLEDSKIAPMFKGVKGNYSFADEWREFVQ